MIDEVLKNKYLAILEAEGILKKNDMSELTVNTKKLDEIYKEWRGNKSCYDDCRPVFDASELLDFAEYCLKHKANSRIELDYVKIKDECYIEDCSDNDGNQIEGRFTGVYLKIDEVKNGGKLKQK